MGPNKKGPEDSGGELAFGPANENAADDRDDPDGKEEAKSVNILARHSNLFWDSIATLDIYDRSQRLCSFLPIFGMLVYQPYNQSIP